MNEPLKVSKKFMWTETGHPQTANSEAELLALIAANRERRKKLAEELQKEESTEAENYDWRSKVSPPMSQWMGKYMSNLRVAIKANDTNANDLIDALMYDLRNSSEEKQREALTRLLDSFKN